MLSDLFKSIPFILSVARLSLASDIIDKSLDGFGCTATFTSSSIGFNANFYSYSFTDLIHFTDNNWVANSITEYDLSTSATGVTDPNFTFSAASASDASLYGLQSINLKNTALELTGYFIAPESGIYQISVNDVDDGIWIWLGSNTAFTCCTQRSITTSENDILLGVRSNGTYSSYVYLDKDVMYPMKVEYINYVLDASLSFNIVTPSGKIITDFSNTIVNFDSDGISNCRETSATNKLSSALTISNEDSATVSASNGISTSTSNVYASTPSTVTTRAAQFHTIEARGLAGTTLSHSCVWTGSSTITTTISYALEYGYSVYTTVTTVVELVPQITLTTWTGFFTSTKTIRTCMVESGIPWVTVYTMVEVPTPTTASHTTSSTITSSSSTSSLTTTSSSPGPTTDITPFGSAYYYENHVYYDIVLPKYDFSELYIFPYHREQDDYQTASGVYSPSDRSFEVSLNNTQDLAYAVVSANVSFSEDDVFANISLVSLKSSPFQEYVKEFLISYDDSLFGPKLYNTFVISMTVTSLRTSSSSSTTSSTTTSSSSTTSSTTTSSSSTSSSITTSSSHTTVPTPFGSAYYYEDHVYYDIVVPKSNISEVRIEISPPTEDKKTVSGVYSPSGNSFEVSLLLDFYKNPLMVANISFSEDDVSANFSMIESKSTPFSEHSVLVIAYELPAKEFFHFTMPVTSLHISSSFVTTSPLTTLSSSATSSTITSSSSTSSVATTSTSNSSTIPTHTSFTPYGSGYYYEDKVYFDFVLPNANYTQMRMSQNFAGPFDYVLDTVSGVYSPSNRSFDVDAVTVGWGVNMRVNSFTFSPDDISANISMVGSLASPFVEGVFKFQQSLLGGSDSGGNAISISVSSLDAPPTPLTS